MSAECYYFISSRFVPENKVREFAPTLEGYMQATAAAQALADQRESAVNLEFTMPHGCSCVAVVFERGKKPRPPSP